MRKFLLLLFAASALFCRIQAQNRVITGRVTDEKGIEVPNASVTIKGTQLGTSTNANGEYQLSVPANRKTLVLTAINMATHEVEIGAASRINVKLETVTSQLSDVVVTGYGVEKKRDVIGAVSKVTAKEIENMPVQSLDKTLQGRMAGVQVQSSNGYPGGAVTIRIRGTGSINAGNSPLYIIDGVQVDGGDLSRSLTSSNSLAGINPNDIESVDVLKDASAAAVYGAQAANGVVIITTKKGRAGKTKFNFNYFTGVTKNLRNVDMLSTPEYLRLVYEGRTNRLVTQGINPLTSAQTTTEFRSTFGYTIDKAGEATTYDWQDAVFRTGTAHNVEISASGGNASTTFFMSGSFNKTLGQLIGTDFTRGTFRTNINHKANDKLQLDLKLNLATYTQNAVSASNAAGSPVFSALFVPPFEAIVDTSGNYREPLFGGRTANVVKVANYDVNRGTTNQLIGSFGVTYEFIKGLTFRSSWNIDYTDILEDRYIDPRTITGAAYAGQANALNTRKINWSTDQVFNYIRQIGEHSLNGLLGFSYRNVVSTTITAEGRGFPNELFQTLQSAATPFGVNANFTTWRLGGYFTKLSYGLKDKYLAGATLRYDGSSRFGASKRYGLFPSGSVGWRISKESFMQNINVISDLKLRASYGVTGNSSIDNFAARSLYIGTGAYNGVGGVQPSGLGNDVLSWEENHSANIGLDFVLSGSRIAGTVEVFRRISKNLLLDRPLPNTSGFGTITQNIGEVKNEGLEFELNTENVTGRFRWSTNFNWTFLRNRVNKLNEGQDRIGTTVFLSRSLGPIYQVAYAGVNPATGRGMFYDANGNYTYLPTTTGTTDARKIIGYTLPTSYGGLTNTFAYKGFELVIFFQSQFGNTLTNNNAFFLEAQATFESNHTQRAFDRRWQKPGDITEFPRLFNGTEPQHRGMNQFASRNYESGAYIRFKQVSLSYNLDNSTFKRIGVTAAKVYMQGVNLATITGYTGYDPEVIPGDLGVFPQGRTGTIGIQLGF